MSPFDALKMAGDMGPMLKELPATLAKWTELQQFMAQKMREIDERTASILSTVKAIDATVNPKLPEELVAEAIANASYDPRNRLLENGSM